MSYPLLDQLTPETRALIDLSYVLTFNTSLKHVHKTRPFVEKSTKSTESGTEVVSSEDPHAAKKNTLPTASTHPSISTTSKFIYQEAIAVFSKLNTINIAVSMCRLENVLTPTHARLIPGNPSDGGVCPESRSQRREIRWTGRNHKIRSAWDSR